MDNKEKIDINIKKLMNSWSNDLDECYKIAKEMFTLSFENGYIKGMAQCRYLQGIMLNGKGKFDESIEMLKDGYNYAVQIDNMNIISRIINALGTTNMGIENYEVALEYYLAGLNLLNVRDDDIKVNIYQNIGEIYRKLGDFDLSMNYFNQLLDENVKEKDEFVYEIILSNICQIMICKKQFDDVLSILEESLDIAKKIKDVIGQAYINRIYGNYFEKIENDKEAIKRYKDSLRIFKSIDEGIYIYETIIDYCKMLIKQGKENEAIKILEESFNKVKKENKTLEIQKLSVLLAQAYNKIGNTGLSNLYFGIYFENDKINNKKKIDNRLKGIKSQLNLTSIQNEKELLKIENEKLEIEYKKLIGINDIVKEITANQTIDEIVRSTYRFLSSIMSLYSISIGIYDKDNDSIVYNYFTEEEKNVIQKEIEIVNKKSFSAWVLRNKQDLILLDNTDKDKRKKYVEGKCRGSYTDSGEFLESIIYLLLEFKGDIIGTMSVKGKKKNSIDKSQLEILQILKTFIAIAINNTYTKQKLEEENETRRKIQAKLEIANQNLFNLSKTDTLTKLKNRYSLYLELPMIIDNAKKSNNCMAVIMIDLDYFKEFNDINGHIAGDMCLEHIGDIFNKIAQNYEAEVYRYGGDEFVFTYILNKADDSEKMADAIRLSIERLKYRSINNHRKRYLTASVGIVKVEPNMNFDSKQILAYVDKALYKAKKTNKNNVQIHKIVDKSCFEKTNLI